MVVSDEQMAFGRWKAHPDKWISSSIYAFYDIMFTASQRAVNQGRRSETFEGGISNATSEFKYYVPNQWQGNFDQYIEVSRLSSPFFARSMPCWVHGRYKHFINQARGSYCMKK